MHMGFPLWGVGNVPELDNGDVAQSWEPMKSHLSVHFQMVNFMLCELYPNKMTQTNTILSC